MDSMAGRPQTIQAESRDAAFFEGVFDGRAHDAIRLHRVGIEQRSLARGLTAETGC